MSIPTLRSLDLPARKGAGVQRARAYAPSGAVWRQRTTLTLKLNLQLKNQVCNKKRGWSLNQPLLTLYLQLSKS
jgi:hypothetical protein